MVNEIQESQWAYLLDPCFELSNSAGKPLTDGWIEVYIAGTRNKYYTASDFDGTLHPFKIPLDSIGSNIVLADPANSYDVYVYNKFGSLIMSRYNVKCQGGGGTSTVEYLGDRLEYGQYTARDITTVARLARQKGNINTTQDGFLKLKEDMSYHITVRGTFVCDHLANVATSLNYIEYSSFSPIKVDIDETVSGEQHFELSYDIFRLPNDMDYQVGFDASNGHISSLAVEVHSLSNLNTTLSGGDLFEQGWGIIIDNNVISVDPSIFDEYPTFDDLQAAVTAVYETVTNETFELVSSVSSVLQDEIDNIQEGVQPDWEQDDPAEPDYIKNKPDLSEFATHDEVISTVSSVSSTLQNEIDELPRPVNADWNAASGLAEILNKPDLDIYATKDEVSTVTSTIENEISEVVNTVCAVSSVLQEEIDNIPEQVQSDWEQDDDTQKDYIKNKPDLDVYATKSDVSAVSSVLDNKIDTVETEIVNTVCAVSSVLQEEIDNIPEQVQSDWDESDAESPAYIQNKPDLDIYATKDELNTATGDIVNTVCAVSSTIETEIDNSVTEIVNTVCAVSSVLQNEIDNIPDQVQSDWEESDPDSPAYIQNKPDLDIYATHDEVSGVSAVLKEIIDEVSAAVPDAQVQSDWTETDDTKKSYIQHKPEVKDVYAGENIILTDTASGLEISAVGTDTETVSAIAKEYADAVSAAIPEAQVQSDWTQDDTTKKDYIKHKPIPKKLVAGDGINITDTVTGVEISAAVTGIEGYVTEEEFIEVVSAITGTGDYGQFFCLSASGACTMGKVKGTIDVTNDGKIKLKQGKSYHMTVRGTYTQATASNIDAAISFIEYVTNNSIGINVDRTSTMPQYFDLGFDIYNLSADTNYYVFFAGLAGTISNLFIEVHTILGGGGGNGGGGGPGTEYNQGWGIVITNNTISVNPSIIPDVSNLATKNEVTAAIATATGAQINADWNNGNPLSKAYIQNKPEEITLYGGQGVDIEVIGSSAIINVTGAGATGDWATRTQLASATDILQAEIDEVSGNIPDVSNLATKDEVSAVDSRLNAATGTLETEIQAVSSAIPAAQVNSDWNAVSGVSEILNKPVEYNLKAGNNITITKSGNDVTISSTGGGGGGGATYVAGEGIEIDENNVISVSGVAMASAVDVVSGKLPTTELGKFTIQSNVSGGPIEVIVPTDQAPDSVFYQINSVSGYAYATSSSNAVINYYYGETPADFNGSDDSILFTINDSISNISAIYFYYTTAETGMGGPNLSPSNITSSTGTLQSGSYKLKAQYNQAGTSGSYGKYLQIMFNWRIYATDAAQSLQWAQEALSKITFFGVVRPDPTLGTVVDLNRYELGNTSTITNTSGYTQANVYTDPTSKKQSVYLPYSMPSNWTANSNMVQYFQYGTNGNSPSNSNYDTKQYRAYKYTSSPRRYQFAYCTDWDYANSIMTFIAYDNSGNAIEKWTLNYNTFSSNVWTTTPITPDMSDYISYSASGVSLPNSKFEIDTNGQAYKVLTAGSETSYNSFNDGGIFFYHYSTQLGTYKAILPSNVNRIAIYNNSGANVTGTFDVATHTATLNVNALPSDESNAYVYAIDSNDNYVQLANNNTTVKRVVLAVTDEYVLESELQAVSAAIPNELSGASGILIEDDVVSLDEPLEIVAGSGVSFTQEGDTITISADIPEEISLVAGQNISIAVTGASAVISSTGGGSSQQVQADWTETDTSDPSYIQNKPDLSNYATQSYVQGYTVPVEVVATSAAATGTNVLYIVTG